MDTEGTYILLIYLAVLLALCWAMFNTYAVTSIKLKTLGENKEDKLLIKDS